MGFDMKRSFWLSSVSRLLVLASFAVTADIGFAHEQDFDIGINQSKEADNVQNAFLLSLAKVAKTRKLDQRELTQFKSDLVEHGWPTHKSGGREVINAAGVLLLAASGEFELQNYLLKLLDQRLGIDVDPAAYARATDEIFAAHGDFQIYGTLLKASDGTVSISPRIDNDQAQRFFRDFYGLRTLKDDVLLAQSQISRNGSFLDPYANLPLSMLQIYSRPDIRSALGRMVQEDQNLRSKVMALDEKREPVKFAEIQAQLQAEDEKNHQELKRIFREVGFPTMAMVGRDGVSTAFILVQHADQDLPFQEEALKLAEPLMLRRELSKQQFAMLTDRVLIGQGKPQRYGTQLKRAGDKWALEDVEDPAKLDVRRESMGLNSSADYIESANAP